MGVTVPADELKRALDAVKAACVRSYPRGAEECVLVGGGRVECQSPEMRLSFAVPSLAGFPETLVAFHRLHSIAREGVGGVLLAASTGSGGSLRVTAGGSAWMLPTRGSENWPRAESQGGRPVCRLPGDQLARCVSCVLPAASGDAGRLQGVKIETRDGDTSNGEDAEDKVVHFVATDGRRLHTTRATFEQDVDDADLLVPAAAMRVVSSAAARCSDAVQVCVLPSAATFSVGALTVYCGVLDRASFPQWRKVIPSRKPRPTIVTAAAMLAAVRQAAIVTSEQSKAVTFRFSEADGITLSGKSADYGQSTATVAPIKAGAEATVQLDPKCVSDFLAFVAAIDGGATVSVDAAKPDVAVVLSHDDATAIVMPICGGEE